MMTPTVFRNRDAERKSLDDLLQEVCAGQSRVLVVRGDAGVGKSALLDYLATSASQCRIARAVGTQYEMELAYSGLHQLCGPVLHLRDRLPHPQRDALGTAFGLSASPAPDRFLVGLAVLGLLSEAAEERPLICLIDDAQWLDKTSAMVLAFVARRLLAESIGFVFAVREPNELPELSGLPELVVDGLGQADARALLDSVVPGRLDDGVRARLVAESRGNPLALLEIPRGLNPSELGGGFSLPEVNSIPDMIEQSFLRRLEPLPPETRRMLLVAAAEPVGDPPLLWRAAAELGLPPDAASPAEAAGLFDVGTRVTFRHPLVRSAIYRAALPTERRDVHAALAEATDAETDPDRRAWHRANAAAGPDDEVADELERSADRARRRGGVAAAAAFLERAAELTGDSNRRAARALEAAQAKLEVGSRESAEELLDAAALAELDELQRARLQLVRAHLASVFTRGSEGPTLLADAAERFATLDGAVARDTYVSALGAAMYAGRADADSGVLKIAAAAQAAPPAPEPARPTDLLLDGLARRCIDGPAAGAPALKVAIAATKDETLESHGEIMRWLMLTPIVQSATVFELWDDESFDEIATRAVTLARETGALALLSVALACRSGADIFSGNLDAAEARLEESDAIAIATGNAPHLSAWVLYHGWRGIEEDAARVINAGREATGRPDEQVVALADYANAVLNNGLGRYEAAMQSAQRASENGDFGYSAASLPELVEAAARLRRLEEARAAVSRLERNTRAAGTDWALGLLARARALTDEGDAAEALYREAIERLERTSVRAEHARAHLVYGEWLRRENRRAESRAHLRKADDMFSDMGARAFAERCRRELAASGEVARQRLPETRALLTAQEAQIAQLAHDGLSNPEIGGRLFISPRTVEYHLHKVFVKLEITSRSELARLSRSSLSVGRRDGRDR